MNKIDEQTRRMIERFQRNEITEYFIYLALSRQAANRHNSVVLKNIADQEKLHYEVWRKYSGHETGPNYLKRWFYVAVSVLFGITFAVKLMEKGENGAQISYARITNSIDEANAIMKQENEHEKELVNMIDEKRLDYIGSIVLGLNDALIEFTGALAGFTLAMRSSRIIAMAGLIMGVSASLSMAASEYFSTKAESKDRHPVKAAFYTGIVYVFTVIALVLPYFLFQNVFFATIVMLIAASLLILVFTYYFSVIQDISFREHFTEMFVISMGVAAISFVIGLIVRKTMRIEI